MTDRDETPPRVTLADVQAAAARIAGPMRRTPLLATLKLLLAGPAAGGLHVREPDGSQASRNLVGERRRQQLGVPLLHGLGSSERGHRACRPAVAADRWSWASGYGRTRWSVLGATAPAALTTSLGADPLMYVRSAGAW